MRNVLEGSSHRSPTDDDLRRPKHTKRQCQLRDSGTHRIDDRWLSDLCIPTKRSVGIPSASGAIRTLSSLIIFIF